MCDYSLHHVATRPAQIQDKLVTTKFKNSITRGFAAVGEPHVAVCLMPGTEIAFDENVECEPSFGSGILPNKKIAQRLARFRQINMDNAVIHHDALEFRTGRWCFSRACARASPRPCCNCPLPLAPKSGRIRRRRRFASLRFLPDGCMRIGAHPCSSANIDAPQAESHRHGRWLFQFGVCCCSRLFSARSGNGAIIANTPQPT